MNLSTVQTCSTCSKSEHFDFFSHPLYKKGILKKYPTSLLVVRSGFSLNSEIKSVTRTSNFRILLQHNVLITFIQQIFVSNVLITFIQQIFVSNVLITFIQQIFLSNVNIKCSHQMFSSNDFVKCSYQMFLSNDSMKWKAKRNC